MADPVYTLVTTPVAGQDIRVVGTTKQIVLGSQRIKRTPTGFDTLEVYGTTDLASARAFQADCLLDERCSDCEVEQQPPDFTITVRWAYDRNDTSWGTQKSEVSWELDMMELSKPLATHPYFVSASGAIMAEIGKADYQIATGQKYVPGALSTWMDRYVGLKLSGVDDWTPSVIMLRRKTRVYKSLPDATWKGYYQGINRTYKLTELPTLPTEILAALSGLTTLEYDAGGGVDPKATPAANFLWVKKPPQLQMVGRNPNGPRDVSETWMGVQYASAVLYPSMLGTCAAYNLWDPKAI